MCQPPSSFETAQSLSSGAHSRDPLAPLQNEGYPYSSPCTFGISWVGRICGAAGFASTAAGAATCGAGGRSAGFIWTAADCCAGSGAGLAASGFISSVLRGGDAFGVGTSGVRLATFGTEAGGRG